MQADPAMQKMLLDLQEHDSHLDQISHQLANLPEINQLHTLTAEAQALQLQVRDFQVQVSDLTSAQKKADLDVEQVKARQLRDQQRIDQGLITNPKDLEKMTHELESLARRVSELEDVELEVMEELETVQRDLDQQKHKLDIVTANIAEVTAKKDEASNELRSKAADLATARDQIFQQINPDLAELYQKLRISKGGIGAALLRAKQCSGCMLTMNPSDLDRITHTPSDQVVRCEECSRILVRTNESGLG